MEMMKGPRKADPLSLIEYKPKYAASFPAGTSWENKDREKEFTLPMLKP